MQRLFFKIFLWFWLAIIVVGGTLIVSTGFTHSRRAADERWRQRNGPRVDLWAQQEAGIFDRDGKAGVQKAISAFEELGVLSYTFDAQGQEILGREAPQQVLQVLAALRQTSVVGPQIFSPGRMIGEKVAGPSNRSYFVIAVYPPPPAVPGPLIQLFLADLDRGGVLRLAAVLAVAGLFCYWLARTITRPIEKLRLAAREIAGGRLETRVDPSVVRRGDELGELGRDFDRMAERIGALVDAEHRLLADVSHTLRSPLARLSVALGLARRHANAEVSGHLDRIERETDHLNRLIGQLLTMARVESEIDFQPKKIFDLGLLVEEVAADGDYEARSRGSGVKFTPPFRCRVEGSPEILRYAIENVVRNAVQHTAPGTDVEITLETQGRWPNQRAILQVRDHGAGIPEEEMKNLFVRFRRVVNGVRQDSSSTGLGLAITERAFRLHGGRVAAASAPGGGLIVTLELPMLSSDSQPASVHAPEIAS